MREKNPAIDSITINDTLKRKAWQKAWSEGLIIDTRKKHGLVRNLYSTTYPDFYFEDFNGKAYSISDFNNEKVILNFNYTFCDRCIRQIDSLIMKSSVKNKLIVLLHDKKIDADHIYERYGDKILLGFISLEYEKYYTLHSITPVTWLLDKNRQIVFFDDNTIEDKKEGGLFQQLKEFND